MALEWFYSEGGKERVGPVSQEELVRRIESGDLDADLTLVWNETMSDWVEAKSVQGLTVLAGVGSGYPSASEPPLMPTEEESDNPFAAPRSNLANSLPGDSGFGEIVQPRPQLDYLFCLQQGWRHTLRCFWPLLGFGIIYFLIAFAIGVVEGLIEAVIEGAEPIIAFPILLLLFLGDQVITTFLALGMAKASLDVVDGGQPEISTMFSQGHLLWTGVGAGILFGLILLGGFIMLVIPFFIFLVMFGFYQPAIVDRNLGVIDSLKYSMELARENKLNLFILFVLSILIALAGLLCLVIGLAWAAPTVLLAYATAFRYLQVGPQGIRQKMMVIEEGPTSST